ncbi:MAG: NAD-dependent epimerase/dehydratase family protein [Candidatus Marinimicrobia bacterium]|nr:NAD-dependent epimerase/dehydratase family protein [candidate division WOR-3 bacterium]MCK4445840.1 NAD-dependent epimerase/dehydratase family protein [Candidatus Neomarinimicrobiota bacterium]
MNILIFGGAGFIGSAVARKLKSAGHRVVSVDNLITGSIENLEKISVKNYKIDITNFDEFNKINYNPDVIIHLAFPTSLCNRERNLQYEKISTTGTLNIFEYAKNMCSKIIYGSSISVYGIQSKIPINEDSKINPYLIYGCHKYLGELYLNCYRMQFGLPYNILRISDVFGPYDKRKNAINNFINSFIQNKKITIQGNGEQVRTYTYIEDVAHGLLLCLNKFKNRVYNLTSDNSISINQLVKHLEKLFNKKAEIVYKKDIKDKRKYIFDNSKFKNEFGNFELTGFENGLLETIKHLKYKYENSNTSA